MGGQCAQEPDPFCESGLAAGLSTPPPWVEGMRLSAQHTTGALTAGSGASLSWGFWALASTACRDGGEEPVGLGASGNLGLPVPWKQGPLPTNTGAHTHPPSPPPPAAPACHSAGPQWQQSMEAA